MHDSECAVITYCYSLADPNGPSSRGNEFILGFIGNYQYESMLGQRSSAALFVTTDDPDPVSFTVEYFGTTVTDKARRGQTTLVQLPIGRPGEPGDVRVTDDSQRNKGVRVKAEGDKLLTVYGINDADVSTDAFLALPCHKYPILKYKYFVFSTNTVGTSILLDSRFLIVPCEDATSVTVIPTKNIKIPADITHFLPRVVDPTSPNPAVNTGSFMLNRLQTLQFDSTEDLTGTIIESDKPISVFVGHECGQVPAGSTACDHLVEQVPPHTTWGTRFFTVPLDVRESGECYRVGTVVLSMM